MLGRALAVAARFEKGVKVLLTVLKVKEAASTGEEDIQEIAGELEKKNLYGAIENVGLRSEEVEELLHKARRARNFIAHDAAVGLDTLEEAQRQHEDASARALLMEKVRAVAEGDRLSSTLVSIATDEPMPSREFLTTYVDRLVQWVMEP